ncbi:NAD-dependent epimerase/dehydratase family protein [Micromonospora sp. NPDC047740]|uniref:NAD-dependent epimerase/dehydratase family protein n=1 Tax=Micromonospora sp. NPDC047740 TaxID=3364254 RepID=UPI00371CA638
MKVVVTGGAGFIGSHVVQTLEGVSDVTEVVVVDDLSTGRAENLLGTTAEMVQGSVLDDSVLDKVLPGAASVVHLAAVPSVPRSIDDPLRSHHANATGTLTVLEAARRHRIPQVVLASSSSVYGANTALPKREAMRPMPLSPYAVSKLATESYALAYRACFGLPVLPVRFFNVFGPRQPLNGVYSAVVPAFVAAALEGRPLRIFGDGRQTRDFTYVGTVAQVLVAAVTRRVSVPDVINLAFGTRTSLLELITELEEVLGRKVEVTHDQARPGDVRDSQADGSTLRSLFPDIQPVPLRAGIEATVTWRMGQDTLAAREAAASLAV